MTELYEPKIEDLRFRQKLMADEATMSYNKAWGGTIPFPESAWEDWHEYWLVRHKNKRFYRYLKDSESGNFVGEIAYHYDEDLAVWLADVIVLSEFRGKGFGVEGLRLLCEAAAVNGIDVLRDNIAIDNPAVSLFLKAGFTEEYRTDEIIMLKKDLRSRPRKIMVIGSPGSGKSTFAGYLAKRLHCGIEESLQYAAALVSLKMETPGPFTGTEEDVYAYMKEYYSLV